jgi:hypothetical protein
MAVCERASATSVCFNGLDRAWLEPLKLSELKFSTFGNARDFGSLSISQCVILTFGTRGQISTQSGRCTNINELFVKIK